MSREIKFRAWDGEKMVSPDYIHRSGNATWRENSCTENSSCVMQYTGLKDKNVWEADIILFEPIDHSTDMPQKAVVEYCEKRACFIAHNSAGLIPLHSCRILEVIGNIHENSDLLKGKDLL